MAYSTIQIDTGPNYVIVYDQYGNAKQIGPNSVNVSELAAGDFCTISVPIDAESGEHPPESDIPAFAEKMLKFWKEFFEALKKELQNPVATPTKE